MLNQQFGDLGSIPRLVWCGVAWALWFLLVPACIPLSSLLEGGLVGLLGRSTPGSEVLLVMLKVK
jgi:hypothetical protein